MDKQVQGTHSMDGIRPAMARNPQPPRKSRRLGGKKLWWLGGAIVVVIALTLGAYFTFFNSQIDSSKYQAVFLSNGQVYFGKLHGYYTGRPYLTDVYYIQGSTTGTSSTSTDTNQQLVKLGSELHAPEDEMILNKSSILFVENLTSNGKVVQLIEKGNN